MYILPYLVKDGFNPTAEMISSAEMLLSAIANEQMVRQQVIPYKIKILAEMRPKISRRWIEMGKKDRIILDPALDYLLSSKAFRTYHRRCTKEGYKLGYVFPPTSCPLLLAESARRDAQATLVKAMESFSGLTQDNLFCRPQGVETYNQYVKDSLYLLTPFCQLQPANG